MRVGLLDSGIGGLSILRAVRAALPQLDLIYVADQLHLPYGPRRLEEVQGFTEAISRYLAAQDVAAVVIACNTASAAALHYLRRVMPEMPFIGLEPAVRPAAQNTHHGKIAIIATQATFQGQLYNSLLERYATDVNVIARAAPELVMLAERGGPWTAEDYALAAEILRDVRESGADQLVLGCTHFPFVAPLIQAAVGEHVTLIDPAPAIARQVARVLGEQGNLPPQDAASGTVRYFTTGEPAYFAGQITRLLDQTTPLIGRLVWEAGVITEP